MCAVFALWASVYTVYNVSNEYNVDNGRIAYSVDNAYSVDSGRR